MLHLCRLVQIARSISAGHDLVLIWLFFELVMIFLRFNRVCFLAPIVSDGHDFPPISVVLSAGHDWFRWRIFSSDVSNFCSWP